MSDLVQQCKEVLSQHARSFQIAAWFLPAAMRQHAALCYAFCRRVDDIVDETVCSASARTKLQEVEDMLNGSLPADALVTAFSAMCRQLDIGLRPALDLIRGARTDLERVRMQTDHQLLEYCYRVAGTVGLMMCGIMGVRDKKALRRAIDLGVAMQLTNICRDVLEDAQRDRVYLPAHRLKLNGIDSEAVVLASDASSERTEAVVAGIAQTVSSLLSDADELYSSAESGFVYIPAGARVAICIASALYHAIGQRLRTKYLSNPLLGRVFVPWWSKCAIVAQTLVLYVMTQRKGHLPALQGTSIRG